MSRKTARCPAAWWTARISIFEPGFLRVVLAYYNAGALPAGTLVKFYFSEGGYLGAVERLT